MIDRSWFRRHPVLVAFDLIGARFEVERDGVWSGGRITETEAYGGTEDLASHAGRLKSGRAALEGEAGRLYMYRSYGIHTMVNVVAHAPGDAGAVLIRALEPRCGLDAMSTRRGVTERKKLTIGPGVLCTALALRLSDNGRDILDCPDIQLAHGERGEHVMAGPRIGITRAVDHRWRFFDATSPFVSAHRRGDLVTIDALDGVIRDGMHQGRPS